MYDYAIIGGGYGGLSAAALLAKKGKRVVLFEASQAIGGRSSYYIKEGFVMQYGQHSHRLERDGYANEVFKRLGESIQFIQKKGNRAKLFYKGKLYDRPEGPLQFLTTDILSFKARLVFLQFYVKLLKADPNDWYNKTLKEFFRTFFTNDEVEQFISFLGFTIMNPDISIVSAGEVIDFIQRVKKAQVKQGEPIGGAKQIIDKLSTYIIENSGQIKLNHKVDEIVIKDNKTAGISVGKNFIPAHNIVFGSSLKNLFSLVDEKYFDKDFARHCKSIKNSSGVIIDFISREPLALYSGGILGVDEPLWVKYQSLIDNSIAPEGFHVCTWGMLNPFGFETYEETEKRIREIAQICMPGFEKKVIDERKLCIPVVNGNVLLPSQSKPYRPGIKSNDIENLFFVGDTTAGDGCSGDIAFSSALKLDNLIK